MKSKSVDIILPTYNGERWLANCIKSVVNQTLANWFLYIVDDGSNDLTPQIAKKFESRYPDKIKILQKKGCAGAPQSRMEAIAVTTSEFLTFIDQDDEWVPTRLEMLYSKIINESYDLVFSDVLIIDGYGNKTGLASKENAKRKKFQLKDDSIVLAKRVALYCPIRIGAILVSRERFLNAGGFNVKLRGGEDWDFFVRFAMVSGNIGYISSELLLRRSHGNNTSIKDRLSRLESWINASSVIASDYPEMKFTIWQFKYITMLRALYTCVKFGDSEAFRNIIRLGSKKVSKLFIFLAVVWKPLYMLARLILYPKSRFS